MVNSTRVEGGGYSKHDIKGVVSCNTGGSDETPTLVGTGVPHRQRSQGGAVLTITTDRQSGVDNHRGQTERLGKESGISGRDGNRCGSERCARGDLASPSNKRTDNGPRKTHGRCRKAPREVEPFAWLGAPGTEALLRGQHSEGNVWNVLSRRLRGQYSEENVWNVLSGRLRGQYSGENVWNVLSGSRIYGQTEVGMLGSQRCDSHKPAI